MSISSCLCAFLPGTWCWILCVPPHFVCCIACHSLKKKDVLLTCTLTQPVLSRAIFPGVQWRLIVLCESLSHWAETLPGSWHLWGCETVHFMHIGADCTWRRKDIAHISQLWSRGGWYHTALGMCSRCSAVGAKLFGTAAYQQTVSSSTIRLYTLPHVCMLQGSVASEPSQGSASQYAEA